MTRPASPALRKALIRSLGTLAKTDAINARALARYGQERHDRLKCWVAGDAEHIQLHALVMARRDIVADRTAWGNRQKAPGAKAAYAMIAPILKALDDQLAVLNCAIARLVQAGKLAAKANILQAIQALVPSQHTASLPSCQSLEH
jgi:transposase